MRSGRPTRSRQGAAFLMLVVLVLLVIVAAAKTMIVSEISLRRGEVSSLRESLLNTAIDRVRARSIRTQPARSAYRSIRHSINGSRSP